MKGVRPQISVELDAPHVAKLLGSIIRGVLIWILIYALAQKLKDKAAHVLQVFAFARECALEPHQLVASTTMAHHMLLSSAPSQVILDHAEQTAEVRWLTCNVESCIGRNAIQNWVWMACVGALMLSCTKLRWEIGARSPRIRCSISP
eukprot:5372725-Amphidinium_carterae.1